MRATLALYIHIPFCKVRCPYCDFNTYARREHLVSDYVDALIREIRLWEQGLGKQAVHSIFFGGGTPSYIPVEAIERIMETCRQAFEVVEDAEVTLEANPDDASANGFRDWFRTGVNRLSMGAQSLDNGLLTLLGRRHSAGQVRDAYDAARQAGFGNISLDFMFGIPHQTMEQWRSTLEEAIDMGPEHLSLYCLTLEHGAPMQRQVDMGRLLQPDSDLAADMYSLAEDMLAGQDYRHYEISNWAKPGYESRHNLTYWHNQPYLGVGAGAHSYLDGHRFSNVRSPEAYIRRVQRWAEQGAQANVPLGRALLHRLGAVHEVEQIENRLEMGETLMLGLRLEEGVSAKEFRQRFGRELYDVFGREIAEITALGLLETNGAGIRLTRRGRLLGNEVFARFIAAVRT